LKKAGDIINEMFSGNLFSEANKYSSLFVSWEDIVGKRIAAHSKIIDFINSIIIVEVDHPGWSQLIQIEQAKILQKMKKKCPTLNINGIAIQLKI
jgi:hypothetical protein